MDRAKTRLQEQHLTALAENGGFQFTKTFFPYASGEIDSYYVQSAAIMQNGIDYHQACDAIENLVREVAPPSGDFGCISGGESRDWMFSFPVAEKMRLPHAMIYKDGKRLGADMKDKRVVHIADLNNEGSSPRDYWIPAIKDAGGTIEHIFFYVDRLEDGVQVMEDLGLQSHSLVPLDAHAWDYLKSLKVLGPQTHHQLIERAENKDAWARKMLKSKAGKRRLADLFEDSKTNAKARKILDKGYPDMKEELRNSMIAYRVSEELLGE